jgi:glycosyltransferase involved in cell wall biosynthesis
MRIVFVNSNCRREGGVETYLDTVMPALQQAGHEVSLCHEWDLAPQRAPIRLPAGAPAWCVGRLGLDATLAAVRQWRPDVIYRHNIASVELERELLKIAPAVFFAHAFYGTCISGSKAFKLPTARPCHRRFGWQCLLHFYPRRCGGMNPLTMLKLYRTQTDRRELLKSYRALITHSEYLQDEYVRHGVPAERSFCIPYCVEPLRAHDAQDSPKVRKMREASGAWRLVFAGRMDNLKGGLLLLEALRQVRSAAGRPLQLVFAGDGPERKNWEAAAGELHRSDQNIRVEFAGWLAGAELGALFDASDLLVVPSVWPEPFGIVGVQAALEGLPAAAFDVGGISKWLVDGVNGHLAPGDPPSAAGLAAAIVKCFSGNGHYSNLCSGAADIASRFTIQAHVPELIRLLEAAVLA